MQMYTEIQSFVIQVIKVNLVISMENQLLD